MIEEKNNIRAPRRGEKAALRLMILIGVASMVYLLKWLLRPLHVGFAPFYWLIISSMVYLFLRIIHEWYHYFFITASFPAKAQEGSERGCVYYFLRRGAICHG